MAAVTFAPLPFPYFFQSPSTEGKVQGPAPQTKQECIPKGCSVSRVMMAPCPWSGLCWSHDAPCSGQQMSDCVQTSLDPLSSLETLQKLGHGGVSAGVGGPSREGTAAVWCRVNTHRGPESGRGGSCTGQEQINSPKVMD